MPSPAPSKFPIPSHSKHATVVTYTMQTPRKRYCIVSASASSKIDANAVDLERKWSFLSGFCLQNNASFLMRPEIWPNWWTRSWQLWRPSPQQWEKLASPDCTFTPLGIRREMWILEHFVSSLSSVSSVANCAKGGGDWGCQCERLLVLHAGCTLCTVWFAIRERGLLWSTSEQCIKTHFSSWAGLPFGSGLEGFTSSSEIASFKTTFDRASVIWVCCRVCWRALCCTAFLRSYGMAGNVNVQGEDVKKLDVLTNDLFINMLRSSFTTCLMVSEENENVIEVEVEKQVRWMRAFSSRTNHGSVELCGRRKNSKCCVFVRFHFDHTGQTASTAL